MSKSATVRYFVERIEREYHDDEAAAIAAAKTERGDAVFREVTASGAYVSRQQIWPKLGDVETR